MLKLDFCVDFERDADYCFRRLFRDKDPAGIERRLLAKGIKYGYYCLREWR